MLSFFTSKRELNGVLGFILVCFSQSKHYFFLFVFYTKITSFFLFRKRNEQWTYYVPTRRRKNWLTQTDAALLLLRCLLLSHSIGFFDGQKIQPWINTHLYIADLILILWQWKRTSLHKQHSPHRYSYSVNVKDIRQTERETKRWASFRSCSCSLTHKLFTSVTSLVFCPWKMCKS